MPEPTDLIDAHDPIVADLLAGTLELIGEAGGWVHASTRLVERGGQLSVECDGEEAGPLLRIPGTACVRVDEVVWGDDPARLDILDVPDHFDDIERQMLYVQTALHNQCDKLGWLGRAHPSLDADLADEVIASVRRLVPAFRATPVRPIDLLFNGRCWRVRPADGSPASRLLVPVLDLLNHHRSGAVGSFDGGAFRAEASRPFGGAECALDYGLDRDAMEIAVVYGFADESTDVAHSAPLTVDVPRIGRVRVLAHGRAPDGALLPMEAAHDHGVTTVNRLSFRGGDPLAEVLETMSATGWDRAAAAAAAAAVAQANHAMAQDLIDHCAEAGDRSSTVTLSAAAHRHAAILRAALPT